MDNYSAKQDPAQEILTPTSNLLAWAASGLFVVFLATIIAEIFPVQLLRPEWQLSTVSLVLRSGLYSLLGFIMLHLAVSLNYRNLPLRLRLTRFRKFAVIAAIGFLLLIPLQGFATWRSFDVAKKQQMATLGIAQKRLTDLKKAVNSANSIDELRLSLRSLRGQQFDLDSEMASKPISEAKKALVDQIDALEVRFSDELSGPKPERIWSAVQSGFRTVFLSMAYAFSFAAGAQSKESTETLLESLSHRWGFQSGRSRRRKHQVPFPVEEEV